MKNNGLKTMLVLAMAILTLALVACGGGGIGSNPNIPGFAKNAPQNAEALVATFEGSAEFSEVESESEAGIEFVTAKRTVGDKEYEVIAFNYGNATQAAQLFSSVRGAYDAVITMGGESALLDALAEDGITNFNWDDTGLSYTQNGYEYFWKVSGTWWIVQAPYDGGSY